jgi:hypothetical protein
LLPILLTAAVAAVIGFAVRSSIEQPRTPRVITVERQARAPAAPPAANGPCSNADGTIHGWQGNGTGITPTDYFHFLPRCNEGGRR